MVIGLTAARLRPWRWSDTDALVRHANNRNLWHNQLDVFPSPYTAADARVWLRRAIEEAPKASCAKVLHGIPFFMRFPLPGESGQ